MSYLYNGVELPALPEWDKTKYPYAVITQHLGGTQYWLKIFSKPVVDRVGYGKCRQATCISTSTAWGDFTEETDFGEDGTTITLIVWTNHDVYLADRTLYMAASDPIPVIQRNPSAMLLGFQVGQAIRRMRGKREPVAFLYGHVAKEGETPTHIIDDVGYVGVVLPKLPEVEGHNNAYMRTSSSGAVRAHLTSVPLYETDDGRLLATADGTRHDFDCYDGTSWVEKTPSYPEFSKDEFVIVAEGENTPLVWTKHDILSDDGTPYFAGFNPIPIYGDPVSYLYGHMAKEGETPTYPINGVRYIGMVAPDIDTVWTDELKKTYPFAYVSGNYNSASQKFILELCTEQYEYRANFLGGEEKTRFTGTMVEYRLNGNSWEYKQTIYLKDAENEYILWASSDIIRVADSSAHFEASKPIPVYK